jgi:hypothetical protein
MKYMFWFFLQLLFETFLVVRRSKRDTVINVETSSCKVPVVFVRLIIKAEFSGQSFEKHSNTEFRVISLSGSRVIPCGRTDRQDEAKSRMSQFCELA